MGAIYFFFNLYLFYIKDINYHLNIGIKTFRKTTYFEGEVLKTANLAFFNKGRKRNTFHIGGWPECLLRHLRYFNSAFSSS